MHQARRRETKQTQNSSRLCEIPDHSGLLTDINLLLPHGGSGAGTTASDEDGDLGAG